jgi:prepilin-type N-terminal cleavage/methylation domain-containing protein/prepilin-type processing-associated H-X9-DG protein
MKTKFVSPVNMNKKTLEVARPDPAAFTLIELLVVIAAIAVLAALLLPGLARGNQQAEGDQCMSSLKQLSQAWLMYNADNRGNFPPNGNEDSQGADNPLSPDLKPGGTNAQWCPGRQDPGPAPSGGWLSPINLPPGDPNIGLEWIQAGLIYPYVKNVQLYLCPADESCATFFGIQYPHVRSRSMNAWLSPANNSAWTGGSADSQMRVYYNETDLTVPGPANTFLLIDENPLSINDASFVEDPSEPSLVAPEWIDCPASYHNGACGMSFCDGHVMLKKWRDPTVLAFTTPSWVSGSVSKYLPDILWLVNRSTALKTTTSLVGPQGW